MAKWKDGPGGCILSLDPEHHISITKSPGTKELQIAFSSRSGHWTLDHRHFYDMEWAKKEAIKAMELHLWSDKAYAEELLRELREAR